MATRKGKGQEDKGKSTAGKRILRGAGKGIVRGTVEGRGNGQGILRNAGKGAVRGAENAAINEAPRGTRGLIRKAVAKQRNKRNGEQ